MIHFICSLSAHQTFANDYCEQKKANPSGTEAAADADATATTSHTNKMGHVKDAATVDDKAVTLDEWRHLLKTKLLKGLSELFPTLNGLTLTLAH